MKSNLELDEEQFKIAAVEEKKRRRESRAFAILVDRLPVAGEITDHNSCAVIARWRGVDDVMAHVHTFGVVAPEAAGIIQ